MTTSLLIFIVIVLFVAICALAAIWFLGEARRREMKGREQSRKPAHGAPAALPTRGAAGHYSWDGGIKTSPRQVR